MGKKRKASGRPFGRDELRELNDADSKLRINTYEDVADSEDEFHIGRDKILLDEGPAQKRQKKIQEEEAFLEPSDEEVLAASEDVSDSEGDFEDPRETAEPLTRRQKAARDANGPLGSDSDAADAADGSEEDEDLGGWGTSRKDYYNADTIETEADALEEEAEARRLQQKQLQGMTEADFGFDELEWLKAGKEGDDEDEDEEEGGKVVREVLPKLEITDAMGPEERLKILRTRYPEFEPLAKEFLSLQPVHEDLKTVATTAIAVQQHLDAKRGQSLATEHSVTPIAVVKHGALSAYLAALSMYFALLTSGQADSDGKLSAMPSDELRDHTIMETLIQCRDLWGKIKTVAVPESDDKDIPGIEKSAGPARDSKAHESKALKGTKKAQEETKDLPRRKKKRKSKAQKAAEAAQSKAETLRAERLEETEQELASLSVLTAPSRLSSKHSVKAPTKAAEDSDSDIGEQTSLTPQEAAEKANRKKSLRFYTSQIAQKANKRDNAGRDAGGDADLPYRERLKDRQARLNAEAEARGKKPKESSKGEALGGPSDEENHAAAKELRDGSGSEDYYDLVVSRSADKKASKAALAAAHAQAEKEGGVVRFVEEETADGKRAISYAIEKNKGLAPKRKKDVRNPRVKKRKKFEEKKKKLGSIRQIYKGGEGRGGYGGESTGIKTGLVKSVKL